MMDLKKDYLKYEEYGLEDFLGDEFFIQWVRFPDEDNSHFWVKWLLEHPQKSQLVLEASHLIRLVRYSHSPELSDTAYTQMYEDIVRADIQEEYPIKKKNKWVWIFSLRQVAVFVLFLFLGCIYYWEVVRKNPEVINVPQSSELVIKENPKGVKSSFSLEDGTKVILNSGSKIQFPLKFDDSVRKVFLVGEAFFDVAHQKRPFQVETTSAQIEVLGTTFNVNSSAKGLSVALLTGKVKINDSTGNRMILNPQEMLTIHPGGKFIKEGFDELEIAGWKDKYLVFNYSSIETVSEKLEGWYGVEIEIQGEFPRSWAYSGVYKDESLENVLEGIGQTSEIRYDLKGKKATISHR